MSRVVYKYEINAFGPTRMIRNAEILTVGVQGDQIMVWALVDPAEASVVDRKLAVLGTGHINDVATKDRFVGTAFVGKFVFHVFDLGEQ